MKRFLVQVVRPKRELLVIVKAENSNEAQYKAMKEFERQQKQTNVDAIAKVVPEVE